MKRIAGDLTVLAILIAACSYYICGIATERFDFYDMSIFLDAGYRVLRGQKVYVDFFYIGGPVHLYLHALSFALFGFTKTAVLVHLCVVQALVLAAVYFIARRALNFFWSALIGVVVCLTLFGPVAHPWYDQTAIAFFVLAGAAFIFSFPFDSRVRTWLLPAACGAMIALSFLTKTNVGLSAGGMILLAYLVLARRATNYRPVAAYVLGGMVMLVIVLATVPSLSGYIDQNFSAFAASERLFDSYKLHDVFSNQPFVALAVGAIVLVCIGGKAWAAKNLPDLLLLIVTWVTGVFSAWTGSIITSAYCFFLGLIALYLSVLVGRLPRGAVDSPERRVLVTGRVASWIMLALLAIFAWDRQLLVWTWQPEDLDSSYTLQTPAFAGWHCSKNIGQGVDRSVVAIDEMVPKNESLFILPDCGIIYGLTGHDSYRKVPWGFNSTNSPGTGHMRTDMLKHFVAEPPQWFLVRQEMSAPIIATDKVLGGLGLLDVIRTRYTPAWSFRTFTLYHLNGRSLTASRPAR